MSEYLHIQPPSTGSSITVNPDLSLNVPSDPVIPYIEGDGVGCDVTPVMIKVVDAAVTRVYGGQRKIHWMEVFAGEKATRMCGPGVWLPDETLRALRSHVVSIKGPLTTPAGGGMRSLNVALRQELDLYVCLRPGAVLSGRSFAAERATKNQYGDFSRRTPEDIYAGIEFEARQRQGHGA